MNKSLGVNIGLLFVTACVALGVTWMTWQHTTNQLSWTMMSDSNSYNATVSSVDSVFNIMPVLFGIAVVLIVVFIVMTWLHFPKERIEDNKYLKWFIGSIYYFLYGVLGMVCFLPPFMLGYFLFNFVFVQGNTGSISFIGQTLLLIVAYFAIAGFGYFFKHMIYDKVARKWDAMHDVDDAEEVVSDE